jgi:hypothetical protein
MVLGLLIAAAKSSFDTQSSQITQLTADMILLDNLLGQHGPEGRPIRGKNAQYHRPTVVPVRSTNVPFIRSEK